MVVIRTLVNTVFISTYLRPKIAADRSRVLNFYWMFVALVTGVYVRAGRHPDRPDPDRSPQGSRRHGDVGVLVAADRTRGRGPRPPPLPLDDPIHPRHEELPAHRHRSQRRQPMVDKGEFVFLTGASEPASRRCSG